MKSARPSDTLVPSALIPKIQAVADEERRAPTEIVGEAVERYLSERKFFHTGEAHSKIAQGLESLRQGRGLDGEGVMAELLAGLEEPESRR